MSLYGDEEVLSINVYDRYVWEMEGNRDYVSVEDAYKYLGYDNVSTDDCEDVLEKVLTMAVYGGFENWFDESEYCDIVWDAIDEALREYVREKAEEIVAKED